MLEVRGSTERNGKSVGARAIFALVGSRFHDPWYRRIFKLSIENIVLVFRKEAHPFESSVRNRKQRGRVRWGWWSCWKAEGGREREVIFKRGGFHSQAVASPHESICLRIRSLTWFSAPVLTNSFLLNNQLRRGPTLKRPVL